MNKNLEKTIKEMERALTKARKDPQSEKFVGYGERIIDLVRERNYYEARFVADCFKDATQTFWKGEPTKEMLGYIGATIKLLNEI